MFDLLIFEKIFAYCELEYLGILSVVCQSFRIVLGRSRLHYIMNYAAKVNSLSLIEYGRSLGYRVTEDTADIAAVYNSIDVLQYINCYDSFTMARVRSPEAVKVLRNGGCRWSRLLLINAINRNDFDTFVYAIKAGCPITDEVCRCAADHGAFDFLKFAHENGGSLTTECYEFICENSKSIDCFQYLYEHNCPIDIFQNYSDASSEIAEFIRAHTNFHMSMHRDFIHVVLNTYNNGGSMPKFSYIIALGYTTSYEIIKMLYNFKCPWHIDACKMAAIYGDFDSLKFMHEHGCPWNASRMAEYAANNLRCLKYVHENGCPLTEDAANATHSLSCLEYLFEYITESFCFAAIEKDWVHGLKYVHENGYIITEKMVRYCLRVRAQDICRHNNCLQYIITNK